MHSATFLLLASLASFTLAGVADNDKRQVSNPGVSIPSVSVPGVTIPTVSVPGVTVTLPTGSITNQGTYTQAIIGGHLTVVVEGSSTVTYGTLPPGETVQSVVATILGETVTVLSYGQVTGTPAPSNAGQTDSSATTTASTSGSTQKTGGDTNDAHAVHASSTLLNAGLLTAVSAMFFGGWMIV